MRLIILLVLILGVSPEKAFSLSSECESALHALFSRKITKKEAGTFLKLQGDITLHRLAWTYLRQQQRDQDQIVESVERTITELLNEKYTNADPDFVKARKAFEAQPLSRTALAEIGPYLKEVLSASYEERDQNFKLNASDIKLLAALSKHEKSSAVNGKYDHRMLNSQSPLGMLNFVKLINSSYKINANQEEKDLQIEAKLSGLENVMSEMQVKLIHFLNQVEIPYLCLDKNECLPDPSMSEFFNQSEEAQNIFWEGLAHTLESDDVLLERLSYGDLWLQVKSKKSSSLKPQKSRPKSKSAKRPYSSSLPMKTSSLRPTSPEIIQNAGLIIEDPVAIIIKDGNGRKLKDWEGVDKEFKEALANAIVSDKKFFEYRSKLYNRKTGKVVDAKLALQSLPPKLQERFRSIMSQTNPEMRVPQGEAMLNGKTTFIFQNKLYNIEGKKINPAIIIAEVMSKKLTIPVKPSRYTEIEQNNLVARAHALKNNEPYFKVGNRSYDSYTGRDISSPFRMPAADSKIEKNRRRMYEKLSDSELIRNFHREHPNPDCAYYGLIDKKKAELKILANKGNEVFSSEILVGAQNSDQRTRWTQYSATQRISSSSTGAGIFVIRPQNVNDKFNQKNFNNNVLSFWDEKKKEAVFAIHQIPIGLGARYSRFGTGRPEDRRISGGCANLKLTDFKAIKKWLGPKCHVYVLPEEEGNKFIVRDGELKLTSTKPIPANRTNLYNYSSIDSRPRQIDIKIVNREGNTQEAREFVKALEDEKAKLMKIYKLSNDEYNDLAMLAYGILGNESEFGKSKRLKLKENAQFAVIVARLVKTVDFDEAKNTSRGLTQIKFLPEGHFKKSYPEVTKENLMNPRNSAVATMAYLAEAAAQMRRIAIKNKGHPSKIRITRENMMDFMGYLYQGARRSLTTSDYSKQATPEFNTYYKGLQRHMSYIEMIQRIE